MNEKHVIKCVTKVARNLFNKYAILVMLCSFGVLSAQNQEENITGIVKEERTGQPLPGVNVLVKGTNTRTVTDFDGKFYIKAKIGQILTVSYVSFVSQDVKITTNKLSVSLKDDYNSLDEVVVVGYGTSKRKDLTGAISSISGDELRKTQSTTIDQALQGKVAGVVVQQTSGQPGGGVNIQIRGLSSFGSSSPLYIIDGVFIGQSYGGADGSNPLATINPADIESIDILKDASATAIYGSQATNGVIVITTKRGKEGTARVSYEFSTGFQELIKQYPTMNLQEYATFINNRNAGIGWGFDDRIEFANPQYLGKGTNWQDELFRRAPTSNHVLTVSGGSDKTQYLMSASYFKQEGIALGSDFNRMSFRVNLDNKTTSWLKTGTSLQLAHTEENLNSTSTGVISMALRQTPDNPVRNPDGTFGSGTKTAPWINTFLNPYALALLNENDQKRNQLYANLYAEVTFMKGLVLRNELSGSYSFRTQSTFSPTYDFGDAIRPINTANYSYSQNYSTTLRNFITYDKSFNNKYNLNVLLGHEAQLYTNEDVSAYRTGFISNSIHNISSGDIQTARNSGGIGEGAQESYFGRINLGFSDKYLFTYNVRRDGSSKFPANNRWVTSSSAAVAWKLHNEAFLKGVKNIDELKLRLGYGLTNNQNVTGTFLTLLGSMQTGLSGISQKISSLGNDKLEWEQTKYKNVGLDASFFKHRLSFSVDYYDRRTDGLLLAPSLALYTGISAGYNPGSIAAPSVNIGSISNKGYDLHLNITNIQAKDFTWRTDFTLSHNKNKVLKLNTDGAALYGYVGADVASKTVVGGSIGEFYGYKVDGLFTDGTQFFNPSTLGSNGNTLSYGMPTNSDGSVLPFTPNSGGVWVGDRRFKDLNGDGVITEKDQTFLGSPIPKVQLGFGNNFNYKNFDFNIFFSANVGNKVLNGMRISGDNPLTNQGYLKSLKDFAVLALRNPDGLDDDPTTDPASEPNNVYVSNPDATIVGVRNRDSNRNNRISDRYIEDGSFIRCKNITLGYKLSDKLLEKIHLGSLRVYATVTNAFLITKYKGLDPEVGAWNPMQAGIDSGYYPQSRTFTFGINVGLTK